MPRTKTVKKQLKNIHNTHEHAKPETQNYKITERKGHHEPNSQGHGYNCGCEPSTNGGYAYRDIVAEAEKPENTKWNRIRFYHQSPVVKKLDDKIQVNTHGHGNNSTTRERINKELPRGFKIVQRDYEVKLSLPNGDKIEIPQLFYIDLREKSVRKVGSHDLIVHYQEETNEVTV